MEEKENNSSGISSGIGKRIILFLIRNPFILAITAAFLFLLFLIFLIIAIVASNKDNGYVQESADECRAIQIKIDGTINNNNVKLNITSDNDFEIKDIKGTLNGDTFTAEKKLTEEEAQALLTDNSAKLWNYFVTHGYSEAATAGILGNLSVESGLDPTKQQYGGGPGRGLAQWTVNGGRWKGLLNLANQKGTEWTDLITQAEWIQKEMEAGSWIKDISGFKNVSSVDNATTIFCTQYERPGIPHLDTRIKKANEYYNKFHGKMYGDVKLTGTIKNNEVTIEGTVGSEEVSANGTYKSNKIDASGYIGDTTNCEFGAGYMGNGQFGWPVPGHGRISSPFGQRWGRLHAGIDIPVPVGTPVYASDAGTVIHAGYSGAYGVLVKIKHNDTYETRYGHNSQLKVSSGQTVTKGQLIALSGNTGRSTGPHVHFEVRENGNPKNPLNYVQKP